MAMATDVETSSEERTLLGLCTVYYYQYSNDLSCLLERDTISYQSSQCGDNSVSH